MAFDRFVTFHVYDGHPVFYNDISYTELNTWGEFIVAPVLTSIFGGGYQGQVVIRCPYTPLLTQAFAKAVRGNRVGQLVNQNWERFVVDDISYTLDSVEIREGYRFVDVTGVDGVSTLLPN